MARDGTALAEVSTDCTTRLSIITDPASGNAQTTNPEQCGTNLPGTCIH